VTSRDSEARLARRLEPLRRLRAAKRDRIGHDAAWEPKVRQVLDGGAPAVG